MIFEAFSHPKLDKKNFTFAWIIFFAGLFITLIVTKAVFDQGQNEDQLRFEYEKEDIIRRIKNRMRSYEGALIMSRAFLLNAKDVSRQSLKGFINDTELFNRFPGLQGLGYSVFVSPQKLSEHEKKFSQMIPDYKVWPSGKRDLYSSIIVLEPENWRNKRAIGYDMFSHPIRRLAMEKARDTARAVLSDKVILVQEKEINPLPGFLLYLPLYRSGTDLSSLTEKRKNILGYLYSPFRAPELFKAIFMNVPMVLDVEIYDGDKVSESNLLFNYAKEEESFSTFSPLELSRVETININDNKFTLRFSLLPHFPRSSSPSLVVKILFIGFLATMMVLLIFLISTKQMIAVSEVAKEKERLFQREKDHVATMDEFLSIASHELKTPLTSLKLQAQVMLRALRRKDPDALTPEKITHLIKQIDHQSSRLNRLVDDMLDISRIKTGRLRIQKETTELSEIILEVVERLKPQFMEALGDLPKIIIKDKVLINADRLRIEQVLTNLFTNAIRYGRNRPITIELKKDSQNAIITISDQGMGIAPENVNKIFNRFERAGVSASEVSGLGLGLFITKQIIEAHGGKISVESELNVGSTFTLTLPT